MFRTYGGRKVNPRPCWYVCSPLAPERQIHKSSWNPSLYFVIFGFWGPVGGTSQFIPALFFFFKLKEINRRNSHGKVQMASPLREAFFNEGWQAETSHFTLLAAGPGTFCVTVQGWELAAAQHWIPGAALPLGGGHFPWHYSQKDPPERCSVCFQAGHCWEMGRPSPGHLSWL